MTRGASKARMDMHNQRPIMLTRNPIICPPIVAFTTSSPTYFFPASFRSHEVVPYNGKSERGCGAAPARRAVPGKVLTLGRDSSGKPSTASS